MVDVTVMARIDLRGADLSVAGLRAALPRGGVDVEAALSTVRPIVDAVAERGAQAALEYGESFDGVRPPTVRVPGAELDAALAGLDDDVRAALEVAIERTRAVHADQRRTDVTTTLAPGATVTERWVPVDRVDDRSHRRKGGLHVHSAAGHRRPQPGGGQVCAPQVDARHHSHVNHCPRAEQLHIGPVV